MMKLRQKLMLYFSKMKKDVDVKFSLKKRPQLNVVVKSKFSGKSLEAFFSKIIKLRWIC